MEKPATLPGVTAQLIDTPRLKQNVYFSGPANGIPVIFLHGNFSAALYFEETMLALPPAFRGIAPDLRGYGWTEDKVIDSVGGMRQWSEDIDSLMVTLGISKAHMVGWSMGGGILYRFIADHPEKVISVTLIAPVSPYGFGGSKGVDGKPCYDDFAGSGGGVVNPSFIQHIQAGDRSADDPAASPRNVINGFYYKPPFRAAREEDFLTAAMAQRTGIDAYPGDFVPSANWPNVAPGVKGMVNCWSPKYLTHEVPDLLAANPKPPILWVRGDSDMIVSDTSLFDFGALGKLGYVPGWPGDDVYPPQPMVSQTRAVFDLYAAAGGRYQEHVIANSAHGPLIDQAEAFNQLFHSFLAMV